MISITKIVEFAAAHFLPKYKGKCKDLHGHTYKLEIEVAAPGNGDLLCAGDMIMDFSDLKNIIMEYVDKFCDHKYLNDSMCDNPTAENMVLMMSYYFSEKIKKPLRVIRIRLWETPTSYAEWRAKI
jgi:6-pyruvoyltetrahydropterin/6-carboxytetrahydropterin synthase